VSEVLDGSPATRRRGRQMLTAVRVVTVGMVVLMVLWMLSGAFADPPPMPPALWIAAVSVAPLALAVFWRPAYRVPNCLWLTGLSAWFLGLGGAGWGSVVAPVIGGATIVALFFVPRDGGRQVQWARDDAGAQ